MNIEESIQQINELIEAWELNEACLNQTDIDAIKCLLKQNQELKQKYLNAVADYENVMFEKEQLNSLVNSCQEEIRRLKKQLEEYKRLGFKHLNDKCNELENQQKEFIDWLENGINQVRNTEFLDERIQRAGLVAYNRVLSKYKEIIGNDTNVGSKGGNKEYICNI